MSLLLGLDVAPNMLRALVVVAAASGVVDSCVAVVSCVIVIEVDVITGLGFAPQILRALVVAAAASGVVDSSVAVSSCDPVIEVDVITVGPGCCT